MLRSADHPASDYPLQGQIAHAPGSQRGWAPLMGVQDGTKAALVGCIAALLAMAGSWQVSLWTDEAATIAGARRTLPELWHMLQNVDAVHGLYYLLMHFWIELFGQSALSLRMPSALAIGAGAAGVYVLALRLGSSRLALSAALVFALLPRVTWAGIEARSFSFSAAAAVWLSVLLIGALRRNTTWRWIAYAALSGASVAINIYLVLLLASHAITILALRVTWRQRFAWLLATTAGILSCAPVLYLSMRQGGQINDEELGWTRWIRNVFVNQWFLGGTPTVQEGADGASQLWGLAAVALAALCWLFMLFAVQRAIRSQRREALPAWLVWVVPQILFPTLVIGLYSLIIHPMYNPRYLTFSTPAVAILIAAGLAFLPRYWMRAAAWLMIVLFIAPIYLSQRQSQAKSGADWGEVADYMSAHARAGDAVYFSPRYPPPGAEAGLTLRRIAIAYPEAFSDLRDLTTDIPGPRNGTLDGSSRLLQNSLENLNGVKRIWMIRRLDYPVAFAQADDRQLQSAGFHVRVAWSGPLESILELTR